MRILKIDGQEALAENFGVERKISIILLQEEELMEGDWVIVHTNTAISKIDEEDARETLRMLKEILDLQEET